MTFCVAKTYFSTLGYSLTGANTFSDNFILGPEGGGSCSSVVLLSVSLLTKPWNNSFLTLLISVQKEASEKIWISPRL